MQRCGIICLKSAKRSFILANPIKTILNIPHYFNILIYLVYIATLVSKVIKGEGVLYLNYILIAVSAIFILIYIIMMISGREGKKQIKRAKRYYKWFKLAMKGVSLFIIVYSFVAASGSEKSSMLLPSILISIWLIQVSVEISKHRARVRREKFKAKVSEFTSKFKKKKPDTEEVNAEQYSDLEVDLVLARTDDIKLSDEDF